MNSNKMTSIELRTSCGLCAVFSLRMLGMFMVLPVLTNYGMTIQGANESLIGLAIGIYGLVQALFQIPLGLLSDKLGRKCIIIGGLIIFVIGSIIAAITNSIWGIILGRALQGTGAITAAIIALLSDSIRTENHAKAMMFIGISFSVTFAIALIIGPIITHLVGIHGLFWIITILALSAIFITLTIVPTSNVHNFNHSTNIACIDLKKLLINSQLIIINFSIFCLHAILMSNFVALPLIMTYAGCLPINHWKMYMLVMLISFILMLPCILYAEKKHYIKKTLISCIIMLFCSEMLLLISKKNLYILYIGMQLFFLAFNIMEAILPSIISKESPINRKGSSIGIYLTSQFLGAAFGGILGGWLLQVQGTWLIFLMGLFISLVWGFVGIKLHESSYIHHVQ